MFPGLCLAHDIQDFDLTGVGEWVSAEADDTEVVPPRGGAAGTGSLQVAEEGEDFFEAG